MNLLGGIFHEKESKLLEGGSVARDGGVLRQLKQILLVAPQQFMHTTVCPHVVACTKNV